jgi:transcriptional regulator with PAS, ATPase and Fis domain
MQSLFQHMDDSYQGTVIVDDQARIIWINARYAERFGFADPAAALGQPVESVIPNSQMREVLKPACRCCWTSWPPAKTSWWSPVCR